MTIPMPSRPPSAAAPNMNDNTMNVTRLLLDGRRSVGASFIYLPPVSTAEFRPATLAGTVRHRFGRGGTRQLRPPPLGLPRRGGQFVIVRSLVSHVTGES